jgi:hypothetical protein
MSINDQPPPVPNEKPAVWDLVIEDMRERDQIGRERYRTRLQPNNGRRSASNGARRHLVRREGARPRR